MIELNIKYPNQSVPVVRNRRSLFMTYLKLFTVCHTYIQQRLPSIDVVYLLTCAQQLIASSLERTFFSKYTSMSLHKIIYILILILNSTYFSFKNINYHRTNSLSHFFGKIVMPDFTEYYFFFSS